MSRPRLAVWKFASCDGCQLTLLDCEEELLEVAEHLEIAYFLEASRSTASGSYDLSLIEGSITTAHDAERIREIRDQSRALVTIGACATSGGIQALRNFGDVAELLSIVYAQPQFISTLGHSTGIAEAVHVDFELRGCPISKAQLLEVVAAFLHERPPNVPNHSVCVECKARGTTCIMVARGIPCLGPVTHAGCGALCPSFDRGCYACYGPAENPNTGSLAGALVRAGMREDDVKRAFLTFNAWSPEFRDAGAGS